MLVFSPQHYSYHCICFLRIANNTVFFLVTTSCCQQPRASRWGTGCWEYQQDPGRYQAMIYIVIIINQINGANCMAYINRGIRMIETHPVTLEHVHRACHHRYFMPEVGLLSNLTTTEIKSNHKIYYCAVPLQDAIWQVYCLYVCARVMFVAAFVRVLPMCVCFVTIVQKSRQHTHLL